MVTNCTWCLVFREFDVSWVKYEMILKIESETLSYIPPSRDCFSLYDRYYTEAIVLSRHGQLKSSDEAWLALCSDAGSWLVRGLGVWVIECKYTKQLLGTTGFWQFKGRRREFVLDFLPCMMNENKKFEVLHRMSKFQKERFYGLDILNSER